MFCTDDQIDTQGMLQAYALPSNEIDTFICNIKSIKTLHESAFYNRNNYKISSEFKYLYLNYNNISNIHNNTFVKLYNLKIIQVNHNLITIINSTMFHNNKLLTDIDLSHNRIHDFNLNLNILTELNSLYLNNNLLKVLDELIFKVYVIQSYVYLNIKHNKFACYCNMYWLARLHDDIKSIIMKSNNICSSSKLNETSLECFSKNKTGSRKCNDIILPTCIKC